MEGKNFGKAIMNCVDKVLNFRIAYAHCDVPCGIYDPHTAQIAAHTIIRMDMLIAELSAIPNMDIEMRNKLIRCISVKEQHAEICKHEISILWGDYFKPEHTQANPELHTLVWDTLKLASKTKQSVNILDADALLANVEKIAEIFWKTKNIQTKRVMAPFPTKKEIVYPVM